MSRTQRRKKTKPRQPYKGEDMVDTTTKPHVPKNKASKTKERQETRKEIAQELKHGL